MTKWIICAIAGNLLALQLPVLPSLTLLLGASLAVCLVLPKRPWRAYIISFICGCVWTVAYSQYQLNQRLPQDWQGKALHVQGTITSIPDINQHRARFIMRTNNICFKQPHGCRDWQRNIQLSWYGEHPPLAANQQWRLSVRLKRGRGLLNPVGLDYSAYLLQAHIAATGYVSAKGEHSMLGVKSPQGVLGLREKLHHMIALHIDDNTIRGIVNALTIGDKAAISRAEWKVLQATGTNHLLAISGLHIGMIAGLFFFLGKWIWRYTGKLILYFPVKHAAAILAMSAGLMYSGLAGFAISTQRASIMLAVAMLAVLSRRKTSLYQLLFYAWGAIILHNPLAPLSRGFCLSFLAVFILNYGLFYRLDRLSSWVSWLKAQWLIGVGMLPITLIYFQQFPMIAFLANMMAIPLVGFMLVPSILLTCAAEWILPVSPTWLWQIVQHLAQLLWWMLSKLASLPHVLWHPTFTETWMIVGVSIAIIMVLAPRGMPAKYLAWFALLPLLLPNVAVPDGQAKVTLLDVGQGLAVVLQTKHHTLLYDTGPRLFDYDSGDAIIIPYLHQQGITHVDTLMISHMDLDHRGGVESVMQAMPVHDFMTSETDFYPQYHPRKCYSGQHWQWDGVSFQVLFPPKHWQGTRNNASCVLRVTAGKDSVLLTGDIEQPAEKYLLEQQAPLSSRVLLVPHHGSKTSSSPNFIKTVDPDIGLIANGYRNRYRFPHQVVMKRYQQQHVQLLETAQQGAIELILGNKRNRGVKTYKQQHRHFWLF